MRRYRFVWLLSAVLAACAKAPDGAIGDDRSTRVPTSGAAAAVPALTAVNRPAAPFDERIRQWAELVVRPAGGVAADGEVVVESLAAALDIAATDWADRAVRIRLAPGRSGPLGALIGVRRTASTPIVISGALGADGRRLTVIDGGADGLVDQGSTCIRLSDVAYVTIENIHCERAFPHGINVDDGSDYATPTHHIVIRNVYLADVGLFRRDDAGTNSDCLKLSGVDDFHVIGSEFANCVWGEFIDMVGCHRGLIADNDFRDKPLNGVQTKGGSADILITRNTFSGVQGRFVQLGGDTGEPYYRPLDAEFPASRIHVIANIFRDAGRYRDADESRSHLFSLSGCADCLIAHNTAIDMRAEAAIAFIDKEEPDRPGNRNVLLVNNLYVAMRAAGSGGGRQAGAFEISARGAASAQAVRLINEVAFDPAAPGTVPFDLPDAFARPAAPGLATFDPMIDDEGRPAAGSPALTAGSLALEGLVSGDFESNPYGVPPAVGAFSGARRTP